MSEGTERPIRRVADGQAIPDMAKGGVVAIGNFDGLHRGHRFLLDRALELAASQQCPATVLTFEPHPRTVFKPESPVFRLTPAPLKARLLGLMGFDAVVERPFDKAFSQMTADDFIDHVLMDELAAEHVVTGFDFHFGKARQGSPDFLRETGRRRGFAVDIVEAFGGECGTVISSSRIRTMIAEGDVAAAAGLLGYRFAVEAEVIGGKQLGRTLGYPTANMALPPETDLRPGIYAVRLRRADGRLHDAVASFGYRPTVDSDGAALLETHVFDFDGDLYGETCTISFFGYLRPEEKFDGLDALSAQMAQDAAHTRALLGGVVPLGGLDAALSF
jgi:riboflavin kinase / FMN adenylyltransferase